MIQVLLILACMALFVRLPRDDPWRPWLDAGVEHPIVSAVLILGAMGLACVLIVVSAWRGGRALDMRGDRRAMRTSDRVREWATVGATGAHIAGVLALGWMDAVRLAIGNLVLVDEVVALIPLLCVLVCGWWAHYPIERRVREAIMLRVLDAGGVIRAIEGRWANVLLHVRHEMLLVLVPVLLIMGLGEVISWVETSPAAWLREMRYGEHLIGALFIAGVLVVLAGTPVLLRYLWDTSAMPEGPLRSRIERVCSRWGVRVRELLVWGTHYSMGNAAVMGLFGRARYILLTDALLETLEENEIEAVAAHEVAHVKQRHMPWLAGAILAPVTLIGGLVEGMVALWPGLDADGPGFVLIAGAFTVVVLVGVLGHVSRRFEWQADAFSVRHLSEVQGVSRASEEAAASMSSALLRVAAMAGMSESRGSWRHGSIAERRARIGALVGQDVEDLAIDREVRRVKRWILVGCVLAAGVVVFA